MRISGASDSLYMGQGEGKERTAAVRAVPARGTRAVRTRVVRVCVILGKQSPTILAVRIVIGAVMLAQLGVICRQAARIGSARDAALESGLAS